MRMAVPFSFVQSLYDHDHSEQDSMENNSTPSGFSWTWLDLAAT